MDTNIDNYSTEDLLTILNLDDEPTEQDIIRSTNELINKYNDSNQDLANFFIDVQNTLLDEFFPDNLPPPTKTTQEIWYENEQVPQPNNIQNNKITNRNQQVGFFNTPTSSIMNKQQLGINNDFQVPVAQGTINPNLKNTTTRTVMINSSYRQNILPYTNNANGPSSPTNFTCTLTDTLTNVIEIKLNSLYLPLSWYIIDVNAGTNCFLLDDGTNKLSLHIESGNYTIDSLKTEIQKQLDSSSFSLTVDYNNTNGKLFFTYSGTPELKIIFYDETVNICNVDDTGPCPLSILRNNNLGWFMGFREEGYILKTNSVLKAEAVVDLYGTKNVYIVLDDYNQNRLNKGLVSIAQNDNTLSIPSYFNTDFCNPAIPEQTQFLPQAPRKITQAQLYTINEIIRNRDNRTKTRNDAPTTTDIFAVFPIERVANSSFTTSIVEFGGSLSQNKRTYFGPVNIDRFGVRLIDDNGNTINLNGSDWSFSISVESLYQY
jgi:hypothetical protein